VIIKIVFPRTGLTDENQKKLDELRELEKGGAEFSPVDYEFISKHGGSSTRASKIVACETANISEGEDSWSIVAYNHKEIVCNQSFKMNEGVKAYVLENGKTVDTLPRR